MTDAAMIKEAYAYGAALALQELGFNEEQARIGSVKLAEEKIAENERGMHPALGAGLGAGLGGLGMAALGAGSAFIPGLRGLGASKLLAKSPTAARIFGAGQRAGVPLGLVERTAFKGLKNPAGAAARWARGGNVGARGNLANTVQESYIRGLGGAGLGALGGGLAGGLSAGE